MTLKPVVVAGVMALPAFFSCTKDRASHPEPKQPVNGCPGSYRDYIRPLMANKCALSGCHVTGFPFGDFTGYADLKARVDNGKLQRLVFQEQLMPPQGISPLSEKEKNELQCWIENGAPNN